MSKPSGLAGPTIVGALRDTTGADGLKTNAAGCICGVT